MEIALMEEDEMGEPGTDKILSPGDITLRDLSEFRRDNASVRIGTGLLRTFFQREDHIRAITARARRTVVIDEADEQERAVFSYRPLGWAERLVLHGLANVAREQDKLRQHPWADRSFPILDGGDVPRIRIEYPGMSRLARLLGFTPGRSGRIDGNRRLPLENALKALCSQARSIAVPVLVRHEGKLVRDVEVRNDLWVRAGTTRYTRGSYLDLHAATISSHLHSWVGIEGVGGLYERARRQIGITRMRDELAICDEYMRYLALANAKNFQPPTVAAKVSQDVLARTIGLGNLIMQRRATAVMHRTSDAIAFAKQTGAIIEAHLNHGVWTLALPHPNADRISEDRAGEG